MDIGPEELRRQRDLVARHLEWLDGKIAEADARIPLAAPRETVAASGSQPAAPSEPDPPVTPVAAPASDTDPLSPGQPEPYPSHAANQIRSAKIGCTVITVGAIALFVFVLFVLPYLLDRGEDGMPPPEAPGAGAPAD